MQENLSSCTVYSTMYMINLTERQQNPTVKHGYQSNDHALQTERNKEYKMVWKIDAWTDIWQVDSL